MIRDHREGEKKELLTKKEKLMISHHGIIIMHHKGSGSGKGMIMVVLDKANFHTLRGILIQTDIQVVQGAALGGTKMFQEALQIDITMGVLEMLGI